MHNQKGLSAVVLLLLVTAASLAGIYLYSLNRNTLQPGPNPLDYKKQIVQPNNSVTEDASYKDKSNEQFWAEQEVQRLEWLSARKNMEKDSQGWRIYKDEKCKVTFHIPPVEEPYYYPYNPDLQQGVSLKEGSGALWDIPRGVVSTAFMVILGVPQENYSQTVTSFTNFYSHLAERLVYVNCTYELAETQSLSQFVKDKAAQYKRSGESGPDKIQNVQTKEVQKWGFGVLEVSWDLVYESNEEESWTRSETFYVFERNGMLYEVSTDNNPGPDSFEKETSFEILNKLEFE